MSDKGVEPKPNPPPSTAFLIETFLNAINYVRNLISSANGWRRWTATHIARQLNILNKLLNWLWPAFFWRCESNRLRLTIGTNCFDGGPEGAFNANNEIDSCYMKFEAERINFGAPPKRWLHSRKMNISFLPTTTESNIKNTINSASFAYPHSTHSFIQSEPSRQ